MSGIRAAVAGRAVVVGAVVASLGLTAACAVPGLSATPDTPQDVSDSDTRVQPIFKEDPAHWGGSYIDGDSLIVKFVGQSMDEAQATLQSRQVVRGIRLVEVDVSLTDLEQAQKAVEKILSGDPRTVSWGPDYASSSIHVEVTTSDVKLLGTLAQAVRGRAGVDVIAGVERPSLGIERPDSPLPQTAG